MVVILTMVTLLRWLTMCVRLGRVLSAAVGMCSSADLVVMVVGVRSVAVIVSVNCSTFGPLAGCTIVVFTCVRVGSGSCGLL